MSLARLLAQTAEIRSPVLGSEDEFGNEAKTWSTWSDPVRCRLEPLSGREDVVDRDTQVGDHQVILPPLTAINGRDQVKIDDDVYDVIGPPDRHPTPRGPHHVVARVRLVEGT